MKKISAEKWLRGKLCVSKNSVLRIKIARKLVKSGYKPPFCLISIKITKGMGVKYADDGHRVVLAAYPKKDGFSVMATSMNDQGIFLLRKTFGDRKAALGFRNAAIRIIGSKNIKFDDKIWEQAE